MSKLIDKILFESKMILNEKWITRLIPKTDESKQRLKYMLNNPDLFSPIRINKNNSYSINIQNESTAFEEVQYIGEIFSKYYENNILKPKCFQDISDCEFWFFNLGSELSMNVLKKLMDISNDKIVTKWFYFLKKIENFYKKIKLDFYSDGLKIGKTKNGELKLNNWHYGVSSGADHTVEMIDDNKVLKTANSIGDDISHHIQAMKDFPEIFPKVIKNNKGKAEIERLNTTDVINQIKYIQELGKKNNININIGYGYKNKINELKKLLSLTNDEIVKNWLELILNIEKSDLDSVDWKDDNIGIDKNGKPKLIDF